MNNAQERTRADAKGHRARVRAAVAAVCFTACSSDPVATTSSDAGVDAAAPADATVVDAASATDAADASDGGACATIDAASFDPKELALGESLILQYNCTECHGTSMSGNPDGVVVPGFGMAYPPNLTPDPSTGVACWSDDQLENAILFGIDNQGGRLCPPMPIFSGAGLDVVSAHAIVHFLRSLPAMVSVVPDTNCTPDAATDASIDAADDSSVDAGPGDGASDAHARPDAHTNDAATDAALDAPADEAGDADMADATDDAGDGTGE
jgi:hypothetical protein